MEKIIVLFQKDLRLHDNLALIAAAKRGVVIPLFIFSEDDRIVRGSAAACYLHDALCALKEELSTKQLTLTIRSGNKSEVLHQFVKETGAQAIYTNYRTGNEKIKNPSIYVHYFSDMLLRSSEDFYNVTGDTYKIYSAFYKRFLHYTVEQPKQTPTQIAHSTELYPSLTIEQLALLPTLAWSTTVRAHWQAGEHSALKKWRNFLQNEIYDYKEGRDIPSQQATSMLSTYLAFGEISVRTMWYMLKEAQQMILNNAHLESVVTYEKQLIWREFAYYKLTHYPTMPTMSLRSQFQAFPWQEDCTVVDNWQKGHTGYPIVDAGMRQLWQTGWMHNRVRMIVASFLVKHLLIRWQVGERWFADTLVDFDVAINALSWQWSAGCGIDAAPYFRIFNPILQGQKFDATGEYIKKWVPELAHIPAEYIHEPWKAPAPILKNVRVNLGETYPYPIVDHVFARERALAAYAQIKRKG